MTAKNDITGDAIITKSSTENFRDGWERTFGKKETKEEDVVEVEIDVDDSGSMDEKAR